MRITARRRSEPPFSEAIPVYGRGFAAKNGLVENLKAKLVQHNAAIMATVLVILAAKVIGDGIRSLT